MTTTIKSGITLSLLMSDAVVLCQAIAARIAKMDSVDSDSIDEDALADLYQDRDILQALQEYIKHEFGAAFGAPLPEDNASYENNLR